GVRRRPDLRPLPTRRSSDLGPRAIARYLRSGSTPSVGHNPLGALSVVALLLLLLIQVTLGLFAVDVDGLESGPLSHYVSFEVGRDRKSTRLNSSHVKISYAV